MPEKAILHKNINLGEKVILHEKIEKTPKGHLTHGKCHYFLSPRETFGWGEELCKRGEELCEPSGELGERGEELGEPSGELGERGEELGEPSGELGERGEELCEWVVSS
jgi:hypothetical protein